MAKERSPALFDARAETYDESALHRWLADEVARRVPSPVGDVLDIGAGSGLALRALAARVTARSLTALDPSSRMLDKARAALPQAILVKGTAEALPFLSGSFDTILCVSALPYIDSVVAAREWGRALRPAGVIVVTAHEIDAVTSSRLIREAGRELGIELPDPNAATGSTVGLERLGENAGVPLVSVERVRHVSKARVTTDSFDVQLAHFDQPSGLSPADLARWRERFSELALDAKTNEQRILIATFRR